MSFFIKPLFALVAFPTARRVRVFCLSSTHVAVNALNSIWRRLRPLKINRSPPFIVIIAIASSSFSFLAAHFATNAPFVVNRFMFGVVFTQNEIANSIVVSYVVFVMNNLFRFKKSTNFFFHNQPVFPNPVSVFVSIWMILAQYPHISVCFTRKLAPFIKGKRFRVCGCKFSVAIQASRFRFVGKISDWLSAIEALMLKTIGFSFHATNYSI